MDPTDSGPGREQPSEPCCGLTPSSRGRQRRKNPKYLDYETEDVFDVQSPQQRARRSSSGGGGGGGGGGAGGGAASQKTPAKRGRAKNTTQQTEDGETEATDKIDQESDGKTSQETPPPLLPPPPPPPPPPPQKKKKKKKAAARAKKTPTKKKTPARKTPSTDGGLPAGGGGDVVPAGGGGGGDVVPAGEGGGGDVVPAGGGGGGDVVPAGEGGGGDVVPAGGGGGGDVVPAGGGGGGDVVPAGGGVDAVQQENGTPKPKRKYVRRRPAQEAVPEPEPPCEEAPGEPPTEPEEETTPSGRRRRGAAKAALKYLHLLAKEVLRHHGDEPGCQGGGDGDITRKERKRLTGSRGRRGPKRKRCDSDGDAAGDEDFVPDVEEEEEEEEAEEMEGEEEEAENSDSDSGTAGRSPAAFHVNRGHTGPNPKTSNGLTANVMRAVWDAAETTKRFREEHHSSWVFPDWIPSTSAWTLLPLSDVEKYLPQQRRSAAFRVSREGLSKEETPLQTLPRFTSAPAHPDRWDMLLYAGGPVWAMEWCPTPDGAPASQYLAVACHRGMDDRHYVNRTYGGPGLVQLWDLGPLEYNTRPDSRPALSYGLAQDKGFVWHLKWCPSGGWEPPGAGRKAPLLPRLGLLAVATSSGVVTIYSLPHPDALLSTYQPSTSGEAGEQLPVYQAEGVVTLKLGSLRAPRHEGSGQVLSMDWSPEKPHNILAVGFYDGVVGLWNLSTTSALLRVRESPSLSLLPYRCLLAHDNAVRALAFCPASRYLLVTAGEDRYVKTWDLRRPHDPVTVQKRYLTNEIYWPLNAPGFLLAQENAYAAYGSHGVHYFDHNLRAIFAVPRTGTLWSISYTDWMNSVVTADSLGEVILAILPQIGVTPQYVKRTLERRFPVYFTSLVPHDTTNEEDPEMGGDEEEEEEGGDAVEETDGPDAGPDAGPEAGNQNHHEHRRTGGRRRTDERPPLQFQPYREAVKRFWLHHTDCDLRTFAGSEKRVVWKRMRDTEVKKQMNMDDMPLAALHKVRFSPNMCCHNWMCSAGQTGLVRLVCLRSMVSSHGKKVLSQNQNRFNASPDPEEAVQTATDRL
ncbi:general transcription factor 3C polypeptide 2 isoform X2 [Sebastes fasciatus]|uniref:general transcription factor 3C polypeptide 2 isoform X2 n=1 Tax=Sebastes fasciatus TaxID=394691 RepID=UPI003D9EE57E